MIPSSHSITAFSPDKEASVWKIVRKSSETSTRRVQSRCSTAVRSAAMPSPRVQPDRSAGRGTILPALHTPIPYRALMRAEEHTSELQSQFHLVCRLLLEKNYPQPP